MRLRGRLLVATTLLVLVPLALLAFLIRRQTADRLRAQYERRIDALTAGIEADVAARDRALRDRLRALKRAMAADDRLRLALATGPGGSPADATWLLDWAGDAMALLGLDFLLLQDESGRILSSGHFRNEFDRVDATLPRRLALAPGEPVLVEGRRPDGAFRALARVDSLRLGGHPLRLVGGTEISPATLAALSPDRELVVLLVVPGAVLRPDDRPLPPELGDPAALPADAPPPDRPGLLLRSLPLAALPAGRDAPLGEARLVVAHSLAPMRALIRGLDLQLALAWALVAAGTLVIAGRVTGSISGPLEDLARRTQRLDLDRLDARFPTDRTDEVGDLARFLAAMTGRLRASVSRLREAERRATRGELARQVNHDLRNGIVPLRNVVRHLATVGESGPDELARVWAERRGTLESGLDYLDELAGRWRRLAPRAERTACDLESIVRDVASGRLEAEGGPVRLAIPAGLPPVAADPVGLRRIVENLVANACESAPGRDVRVTVALAPARTADGDPGVSLVVEDDGPGMGPDDLARVFDDFWTTKPDGSGLGLSIVRRLVADFDGTVRLDSRPGAGTRATVLLPARAPVDDGGPA